VAVGEHSDLVSRGPFDDAQPTCTASSSMRIRCAVIVEAFPSMGATSEEQRAVLTVGIDSILKFATDRPAKAHRLIVSVTSSNAFAACSDCGEFSA